VELQGRQVRLVQRRDQRPGEAAVHDPAVVAAPRADHDHPLRTYPVIRDLVTDVGIKITDNAIIPMKERSADQRYDPLGRVVHSWRRRKGRTPAG
jgi:succinate dehydrogenase / fumarate reductase iron-sulfur subunit